MVSLGYQGIQKHLYILGNLENTCMPKTGCILRKDMRRPHLSPLADVYLMQAAKES